MDQHQCCFYQPCAHVCNEITTFNTKGCNLLEKHFNHGCLTVTELLTWLKVICLIPYDYQYNATEMTLYFVACMGMYA